MSDSVDREIEPDSWFIRIQADAEEYVRGLYDKNYEEFIEKFTKIPFHDLPNIMSLAFSLLNVIGSTGRGVYLLRYCIYTIVRNNVRKVRSRELEEFSKRVEIILEKCQDKEEIGELDICLSVLSLVSDNSEIVEYISKNLHETVTKKPSTKMVNQILQLYNNMGTHWRKQWFPICMKIEEFSERINMKEIGLNEFKRYIYNNHKGDWRIMYLALRRIAEIINNVDLSEDIRDSGYWEGMAGGQSIKIRDLADPRQISLSLTKFVAVPLLEDPLARHMAVRFLISMTSNRDDDISKDARKYLEEYGKIEADKDIMLLYKKPNPTKYANVLSKLPTAPPAVLQLIETHFCINKSHYVKDIALDNNEKEEVMYEILLFLGKSFEFQPKKIKTWEQSRHFAKYLEYFLDIFVVGKPNGVKEIISKLKEFYVAIKSKDGIKKIESYSEVIEELEKNEKKQHLQSLNANFQVLSLNPLDYGDYFKRWKNGFHIDNISVESCILNTDGNNEYTFLISSKGIEYKIHSKWRKKNVEIVINEPKYDFLIREINTASYANAFARVQDSLGGVLQKNNIDSIESSFLVDFFERMLVGREVCLEGIIISLIYFLTMFGLVKSNGNWTVPTKESFLRMIEMKLCMSYLYQVNGKKYTEESYRKSINENLCFVPKRITVTEKSLVNKFISEFYNSVRNSEEIFKCGCVITAYSNLLDSLSKCERPKTVFYECSMILQDKIVRNYYRCHLSINKTSIYLRYLNMYLNKSRLSDLEEFIHVIIQRTDINLSESNRMDACSEIIDSFAVLMPYIYTIQNVEGKRLNNIHKSIHKIVQLLGYSRDNNSLETYCSFYILSHYRGKEWLLFEKTVDAKLELLSTKYDISTILNTVEVLVRNTVKFYVLHETYSPIFLRLLCKTFDILKPHYTQNRVLLIKLVSALFPLSPVLMESSLRKGILEIVKVFLIYCRMNKYRKALISVINILNTIVSIRQSKRFFSDFVILEELETIYITTITNLIEYYIWPIWKKFRSGNASKDIDTVLGLLRTDVKEDIVFLEKLEKYYQNFLFSDSNNTWSLETIISDMMERFNSNSFHKRLPPVSMYTYNRKGVMLDERRGYNILEFILGIKCDTPYLKLNDDRRHFLSALISPTYINDISYTTGFGGGGKMKIRLSQHGIPENSMIPAVPTKDITDGKFGRSLEAMTFKEAYYYWQRMFNPYSPDGDIIAGEFKIMFAEDGTINFGAIVNSDGCGFIKKSKVGFVGENISNRTPYSLRQPIQTYQAIHHNKRSLNPELFDETVLDCVNNTHEKMNRYLASNQNNQSSVKELYSVMVTGSISSGRNFVAIPACGENTIIIPLHLRNSDIILGKTPFETPFNLLLRKEHEIMHLKSEDTSWRKLAEEVHSSYGFQYSFIGTNGKSLSFMKGILVVIPDELWMYDADIILCAKDKKVDSEWTDSKKKPQHGSVEIYRGVLTPTQKYGRGSFIAVSQDIQINRWSADYDGDIVTTNFPPKDTKTFNFMSHSIESYTPYSTPKIPKTFTKSKEQDSKLSIFRFLPIVQARTSNLLTDYSKLHDIFVALKPEYQLRVSRSIAKFPSVGNLAGNILVDETGQNIKKMLDEQPSLIIQKILSSGIKTGSDVFKSRVDWVYFKEFEKIISDTYTFMGIPEELVYFKKMCINMYRTEMHFTKVLLEARYQNNFFDSLPLHILTKTLESYPHYKQKRLSDLLLQQIEADPTAQSALRVLAKKKLRSKVMFLSTKKKIEMIQTLSKVHKIKQFSMLPVEVLPVKPQEIKITPVETSAKLNVISLLEKKEKVVTQLPNPENFITNIDRLTEHVNRLVASIWEKRKTLTRNNNLFRILSRHK